MPDNGIKTNTMSVPVGSAPNPDPTVRTMELVDRGQASLRNELSIRFDAVTTRFDAMDEAIRIVKEDAVRVPTMLQTAILTLRELMAAKDEVLREHLHGLIKVQGTEITLLSAEREKRADERAASAGTAIAAALATVKETSVDSKTSFVKQIDQLGQIMNATNGGLNDKVDDLKERMSKLETMASTIDRGKDHTIAIISSIIAGVVGFVVVIGGMAALISFILKH